MLRGLKLLNTRKIKVTQKKVLTHTVFPVFWSVKNIWIASNSSIQLNSVSNNKEYLLSHKTENPTGNSGFRREMI